MSDFIDIMEEICDVVEACESLGGTPVEEVQETKNVRALRLIEEAFGLMTSLCEVGDAENVEDTSKEHNKLKRVIKDKEGNKTDVVSVEDELFPYPGNAKEQFNQKVIAKINDMIEGKATLEDLIQLVRRKHTTKKVEESLVADFNNILDLMEDIVAKRAEVPVKAKKVLPERQSAYDKALANFNEVLKNIHSGNLSKQSLTKPEQEQLDKADQAVNRTQKRVIQAREKAGV